jgi:hypothetical protein
MIPSPSTNWSPAATWSRTEPGSGSMGGSGARIPRRKITEPMYDSASAAIASGAPRTCTRRPPIVGPATDASDRLPLSSAIAST